jgi:hypothetical protein
MRALIYQNALARESDEMMSELSRPACAAGAGIPRNKPDGLICPTVCNKTHYVVCALVPTMHIHLPHAAERTRQF